MQRVGQRNNLESAIAKNVRIRARNRDAVRAGKLCPSGLNVAPRFRKLILL